VLKPVLTSLELGPELRAHIEPAVFGALFGYLDRYPPPGAQKHALSLSVSQAKEILELALPDYREPVSASLRELGAMRWLPLQQIGVLLHGWLHEAVRFFRREGAPVFRTAIALDSAPRCAELLWGALFSRRLLPLIQGEGLLKDWPRHRLEACDLAVESLKLWVEDISQRLVAHPGAELSASTFFVDTESDLQAEVQWQGHRLHLRGKPDALILDRRTQRPEVWEYKFGTQGKIELQVAQTLLYLALVNADKGPGIETGRLQLFRLTEEPAVGHPLEGQTSGTASASISEFPPKVDAAFHGYVGNYAAVRRLKIECTLAVREGDPPRMPLNLMFCGPGGLGKTELARRVARALDSPLVDVPAGTVKDVDALLTLVDKTLAAVDQQPLEAGTDSGMPRFKYPPLVIFLDEIHEMGKRADAFLNFLEPREKRAVGRRVVGDFTNATILAATTDIGLLPGPFLTRFRIIDLVPYSAEEVALIVQPVFENAGQKVHETFLVALARMSRLNPRIALERGGEMLRHHVFDSRSYPLDNAGLRRMSAEAWLVDEHGLRENDLRYLRALLDGRRGVAALTSMLPVGREEILSVIEPYLLQLEAVRMTGGGRELTERGRMILRAAQTAVLA
jgi:holliday junction DNA helicase RuvB